MSDSPAPPAPDPDMLAAGWERRNLTDPERAQEMAEVYQQGGFEVRLVPLSPLDFGPACSTCAETVCKDYLVIYTRKAEHTPASPEG